MVDLPYSLPPTLGRLLPNGVHLRMHAPGMPVVMTVNGGSFWTQLLVDPSGDVFGVYLAFHGALSVDQLAQATGRRPWAVQCQLGAIAARVQRGKPTRSLWRKLLPRAVARRVRA